MPAEESLIRTRAAQVEMRRERSGEEYRQALSTISLESQATIDLLNDLLKIARPESSNAGVPRLPLHLAEFLAEVGEQMASHASVKGQRYEWSASCDAWVLGNSSMLRRLISILIDNAIKYTP